MRRKTSLRLMILLYVAAGLNHFLHPATYVSIMPPYLRYPLALVYISGACEMVFGLLLIPERTRRVAAWLIILLLIAVFPANVQMTINYWKEHKPLLWITILRLPLQIILIRWAWFFTKKKKTKTDEHAI